MMETYVSEQFVNQCLSRLNGKISNDDLRKVMREIRLVVSDYEITNRNQALVNPNQIYPECYQAYIVTKTIEGKSPQTIRSYRYVLEDFLLNINMPLDQITPNDFRAFLYRLSQRKNVSNRTVNGRRVIINTFMQWLKDEGYIVSNPCANVKVVKYEEKPRQPLTDEELEMVREACEDERERAIIEVLYSTGCRVGELVNIKISDIDFDKRTVQLFGKGNKHRVSYISAKAKRAIFAYLDEREDECPYLFVGVRKPYKQLQKTGAEKIVRDIGERSELTRRLYPHLLRHTFATNYLLNSGGNVTELQKLLGHTKMDTTMIYAKVDSAGCNLNHRRAIQ